tara:strand:- start:147 stop:626 length:480 start_codon:yes stop_codon:yes gene_type:complete
MNHPTSYKLSAELDPLQALNRIKELAKKNCRKELKTLYKKTTASTAMKEVILKEVGHINGDSPDVICSKFYLKNFKESVTSKGYHPYNFTTEILVWTDGTTTILRPKTAWGSSKFLDFLERLEFINKCEPVEQIPGEPIFHMNILTPENFFEVDPAWGG